MDISLGLWTLLKPLLSVWNWVQSRTGLTREHDLAIFRKLDALANEAVVDDLVNGRIYTSNFKLEDGHLLTDLIQALYRIENRYLDRVLQKRAEEFRRELDALDGLVRQTFFSIGGGWLKFRPDPIDRSVYAAEWKELCKKIDATWRAYREYRMAIKDRLKV